MSRNENQTTPFSSRYSPSFVPPVPKYAAKFYCEKLCGGALEPAEWKRTGLAPCWEAAARHAGAIGGTVRVLDKSEVQVATFEEGRCVEDYRG